MYNGKTILGLIPARGGSKGIPWKNIVDLGGKPLISRTIDASLKSEFIDRTIVTTDSVEIAGISKKYGADVPFLRPNELALDESNSYDAIFHALDWLKENENIEYDYICLLQPTSPFRNHSHINEAIEYLINSKDALSLISVTEAHVGPYWMVEKNEFGFLKHLDGYEKEFDRRQDMPQVFEFNGAIYLMRTADMRTYRHYMTDKTIYYLMDRESALDIDEPIDLEFARFLLEKEKF
ncbi:MAG: hypothetical protein A2X61_04535 [Ignavibacteria bacterium GWB2_35_12]|nr:MAG: hypothetical protein A2X63_13330 [Ignavibacteria bacterium GWA2_35_8]OGU41899.1 MAG: hypothetical protein A2X61_04535 [Ignavibacteria bacterium GWB2_35_12]OGU87194.1 MAG: hypothetical protein A2220_07930 [Ignavibacteria bacterium RIFOXYA2_FULL_35_10]OGV24573.1 MAG: hypothetical protein A2475_09125 [Ignavibacteria bacterium RIFOXYC2_FULL_35_21]